MKPTIEMPPVIAASMQENAREPQKLTLLDFAEIFLTLPEASKREVLGYAKCLYASSSTATSRPASG